MRMRVRLLLVAVLGPAALVLAVWPSSPAGAACTDPTITVNPDHGKPDDAFTVTGKNFVSGCAAQGASETPNENIQIYFEQGSKRWLIGTVAQAARDGSFSGTVFVPNGDGKNESPFGQAPSPGAATVRAEATDGKPTAAFTVDPGPTANTTTTRRPTTTTAAGATTTTRAGATTTTTRSGVTTTATTATTTTTPTDTTTTLPPPPVVTVESTTTSELAGSPLPDDGDDNRGPLIAVALVLLAAVGVTFVWRAYRGPQPSGGPWEDR